MATYVPLQSVVLTSTATQIVFSGISQDYTDLIIRCSYQSTVDDLPFIRFASNSAIDAGTNYGYRYLRGNGSNAAGGGASGANQIYVGYSNTGQSTFYVRINGYSNTVLNKVTLSKGDDATNNGTYVYVGEWRNTGAITAVSVNIGNSGASFQAGATFDLYGIKSGAPKMMGGDVVVTDGTYWYHAFKTTGALTALVQQPITVDYLVVAGGGGGGNASPYGGGGGAGGFRTSTSNLLGLKTYTVTVGAGGSAGCPGTAGSASTFNSFSSSGGGLGGNDNTNGGSGGSGGGARSSQNGSNTVNTNYGAGNSGGYSPVEGYRGSGGWMNFAVAGAGGGGGGAGAIASDPSSGAGGNGGIGSYTAISGGSTTSLGILSGGNYYFAGGGGGSGLNSGGTGGTGGGGNGSAGTGGSPTAGTANTGGGGGGTYGSSTVGAGGSGIVIVRYAV